MKIGGLNPWILRECHEVNTIGHSHFEIDSVHQKGRQVGLNEKLPVIGNARKWQGQNNGVVDFGNICALICDGYGQNLGRNEF
jgi:hypothetical protein